MKKVIDGKCYNTETAEECARWSNDLSTNDFHYCSETLYRTRKGTYFLFGKGGAASRYSEPVGNMRGAGTKIVPLTENEARYWMEQHFDGDDFEAVFGEVEEA